MGMMGNAPSAIVAIDRTAQGKLLWKREATEIALPRRQAGGGVGSRNAVFEGSPVADARNVYVALTDRIEMTATYVACLDAETGATRWVRYICEANSNIDPFLGGGFEVSHRLLTLDGPTVYYQTNLGVVASLETENGSIRWLATYPWQGRNGMGQGRERDLNPAIVHDGLVIVAPDDAPAIYAFDAATGLLAWKTETIPDEVKLTHLLGVAKGNLIATGDRVLWFDVRNGRLVHAWPDNAQAVQGFGRGILAGDRIYWPTKTEIHVLDQSSGLKADPPIKLQETFQCEGGNLAVGDGYLIVAQASALVVFCQNSRLIDRYRDEIARVPDQPSNYYRLAQAAEAIGRDDLALTSLEAALPRTRATDTIDGVPMSEAIRDHQRQLLMKLGQKARAAKDWTEAGRRFAAAAEAARSDRDQLAARLELADVQLARGDPKASVATLQALLADERMRALNVDAADGHRSVRADLLIAERLAGLIRDKGRDLYADFDRAAADLLARGKAEKDPRLLEDVGRSYPVARVVPGRLARAGRALRRASASRRRREGLQTAPHRRPRRPDPRPGPLGARPSLRNSEALGLGPGRLPPGEEAVRRRADRRTRRAQGARGTGRRSAGARAIRPDVRRPGRAERAGPAPPSLGPPMGRGRPTARRRRSPSLGRGRRGSSWPTVARSGRSTPPRASRPGRATWTGSRSGSAISPTGSSPRPATRLVALSLDKGVVEWQYDLGIAAAARAAANPFAKEPAAEEARDAASASLQDFRIVGNRVFCLRGDRTLMAFDGDSGQLDWSYTPTAGRINPHLLIGPRRIVLQVRKPNAVLVLETATGRRRAEFPQAEQDEWPRDPLAIDDDHVALVVNRTKVALFDTTKGANAWVFEETKDSPSLGPPRLFGDAERLLVLHDGHDLIRLDLATGAKAWAGWKLLGTEDLSDRPEAIALAADRVFVANGPALVAIALSDGSTLWKRPLSGPSAGWDVALTERSVAAYPAPRS